MDRVTLLPFALFMVRSSPYHMGLTPFEIIYGNPPPRILSLQTELIASMDDQDLRMPSTDSGLPTRISGPEELIGNYILTFKKNVPA